MSIHALSHRSAASLCLVGKAQGKKITPLQEKEIKAFVIELIPVVASIAFGVLFAPHFALGMVASTLLIVPGKRVIQGFLPKVKALPPEKDRYYQYLVRSSIFNTAIKAPVKEELEYRFLRQTGFIEVAKRSIPLIFNRVLTSPQLTLISLVGVVGTAILFGRAHLSNPHPGAKNQAVLCTFSGLAYGALCVQYGIFAPIGAHIANNVRGAVARKLHELYQRAFKK